MKVREFKKIEIILLDVQVEIIMKALIEYLDKVNKKYNYRKVPLTKEEESEKALIRDTYMQLQNAKYTKIVG